MQETRPIPAETVPQSQQTVDLQILDETNDETTYPEGGTKAWLVVLGAWCAMVPPMGLLNTLAVLQAWIAKNELAGISESKIGWIFSCYAFFITACGAQVAYYQFLLSFGVLGGISSSLIFTPSLSAIGHWFCKRRAFATGVACSAGGIGGIVFSLIILYLTPRIGFPWAIRVIAFLSLGLLIIANICLRKRIPPIAKPKLYIDFGLFKDMNFSVTVVAIFLVEFAVFIPYTYLCSYALAYNFAPEEAYLLNVLLNTGAIPGRVLPGYIADRFGAFNTMIFTSLSCGAFVLALWLTAGDSHPRVMAFSVLFGFWSGAAISLSPVCISRVCRIEDYGKSNGMAYFVASFGALVGIPIAGSLLDGENGYEKLIAFAGGFYMVACAAFCVARGVAGGWKISAF
ncbi:riboflavin transporter mch5 [Fusarium flagelliforme]|uniref:Riboflavin transporter mch5 n=1 Tax=Fusarium flagelliforme TaxID=2675880 RepID=A0A395MEN6_9HYPO|nr:riboflavin transporter mch5 [Fusarium flagelliforme]